MKNIVIIGASPRAGGNSDLLCKEFERGALESGNNVKTIFLEEKEIHFCKACYACFKSGECIIEDDVEQILNDIQWADVLVIATPTYFLTMNAKLKTLIDRFLPRWQNLSGHEIYLIITGHDSKSGLKLVATELTSIFENLGNRISGIIWGERVWQKGEVKNSKAMAEAYNAGRNV